MPGEKSGRTWKHQHDKASGRSKTVRKTWDEKMEEKERAKRTQELQQQLKDIDDEERRRIRESAAAKRKNRDDRLRAAGVNVKKNLKKRTPKMSISKQRRMKQYAKAIHSVDWAK